MYKKERKRTFETKTSVKMCPIQRKTVHSCFSTAVWLGELCQYGPFN